MPRREVNKVNNVNSVQCKKHAVVGCAFRKMQRAFVEFIKILAFFQL